MKRNKIIFYLTILIIIIFVFLIITLIFKKQNKSDYKYGALFIKRENINNSWRMKNVIQYYDANGNLIKEKDVIDYDLKGMFLSNYLKVSNNLYVYGDRGIYVVDLNNFNVSRLNDLYFISYVSEGKNKDIFFVENKGFDNNLKYLNTIYKNNKKIYDVEGSISDFIVVNDKVYYQIIEIDKNIATRHILDINTLEINKINCDESGVFVQLNDKVYIIDKYTNTVYDYECKKLEVANNIGKTNEYGTYYNNNNKKSYYGLNEITMINNKIKYLYIDERIGYTFLKEKGDYIPLTFDNGNMLINDKKIKINTEKKKYILMTFFEIDK